MNNRFTFPIFGVLGLAAGIQCVRVATPAADAATIVADARPAELSPGSATRDINIKAQQFVDRGKKAFRSGDYQSAIENYSEALKLKPGDARLFYNRGLAHMKAEDPAQAYKDFSDCLTIAPEIYPAWMNRANMNVKMNRLIEALPDYEKAIQLKPDEFLIWYNRGIVYSRLGDAKNAFRDLNEALRLNPYDGPSYSSRADLYFAQGDKERAAADYRRALVITPDAKHATEQLARINAGSPPSSVNGIAVQESAAGKQSAPEIIRLAVDGCFAQGDSDQGLENMAVASGWMPIGSEELKKQSSAAYSATSGWTLETATGPVAIIQLREIVSPPVRICSITTKLPSNVHAGDLGTALQSALKTVPAEQTEKNDLNKSVFWVPHTSVCTARVSFFFERPTNGDYSNATRTRRVRRISSSAIPG